MTNIVTPQTVQTAQAICTAAKVSWADATNAVLVLTAGASGAVMYGAKAVPMGTITATTVVLMSVNGTVITPINWQTLSAYTLSTTSAPTSGAGQTVDFGYAESAPRRLAPNEKIYAATGVANAAGVAVDVQFENL